MQGNREGGCFGLATARLMGRSDGRLKKLAEVLAERSQVIEKAADARKSCGSGLGRCSEEARKKIGKALSGGKELGSHHWRMAGANMRQKCFSQIKKEALGVPLLGAWRFPFPFTDYYNKQLRIMKNRKIIFANQKGGVGKSTLCILFANYLAWKKQDVCVIDTDLQKTIKMQRRKDMELYEGQEEPYVVQDFDVQDPETMQQLMDSASNTEGYVLFDSPGNVSEDGLVPMFTNADFIVCPYEYEEKTLDSTGTFVQVINALRQHTPEMTAKLFFVPNRIDVRIGTKNELDMWKQTDAIFKQLGAVTPRITARAALKRINTVEITAAQREAVKPAFDFMIRRMKE